MPADWDNFCAMAPAHPFEWSLARRVAVVIAASTCVAAVVVVTTDEATSTAGMRLARLGALGPLIASVSVLAVCGHARMRGEIAALEALGLSPWDAARGAAVAGWAFCFVTLVILVLPWADPQSLFPRFAPPIDWTIDVTRTVARSAAATILSDGTIELGARTVADGAGRPARWAAVACLAPIALSVPAWAVTPMKAMTRVASVLAAGGILVVVLHAVAAGRASTWCGLVAAVPLCAALIRARRTGG
jgi:hypothetical protein